MGHLNQKPGLRAALLFAAGILFYEYLFQSYNINPIFYILSLTILIICSFFLKRTGNILIPILIISFGILRMYTNDPENSSGLHISRMELNDKYIHLHGYITEKKTYPSGFSKIIVQPEKILLKGYEYSNLKGKVVFTTNALISEYDYGDKVLVKGIAINIKGRRNPGEYDLRAYYIRKDVFAEIYLSDSVEPEFSQAEYGSKIKHKIILPIRSYIGNILNGNHAGKNLEFLKAILLGERSGMEPEQIEEFRDTGTIHILAVSGLHVGFIVLIIHSILSFFNIPRISVMPYLFNTVLIIYILATGARPPVMRAGIVLILFYTGILLQRKRDLVNLLGIAALIILVLNPKQLFDPGFQLSFAAVSGIILFTSEINFSDLYKGKKRKLKKQPFYSGLVTYFLISLGAFFGTSFFSAYHFNLVVPGSIFLNILIVPLAGIVVGLGFSEIIFSSFSPGIAGIMSNSTDLCIDLLFSINKFFSKLDLMKIIISRNDLFWIAAFVIFVLFIFMLYKFKLKQKPILSTFFILTLVVWGVWWTKSTNKMTAAFLDVGQGDCTVLSFPDGSHWMIDAGNSFEDYNAGDRHIVPYLKWAGIKKLSGIIVTHPNIDHYGGISGVLEYARCDSFFLNTELDNPDFPAGLKLLINGSEAGVRTLKKGDIIAHSDFWKMFILSPPENLLQEEYIENEQSLVTMLYFGNSKIQFTGDAGSKSEKQLLVNGNYLKADIIKAGHHGSKFSSSLPFLQLVSPKFAVIQSGRFNRYGHPDVETLSRMKNAGIIVKRTDIEGAVIFELDGYNIYLK